MYERCCGMQANQRWQGAWIERMREEELLYIDTGTEANASSSRGMDNTFA